jgi:hypothetical protein
MKFLTTFQTADFFDTLVSLGVAFVLGTLIGAERQYRQRTAACAPTCWSQSAPLPSLISPCISPGRTAACT